jgi:Holliday junction resolvase RusA-like endonuclease
MPRFYFHVQRNGQLTKDPDGVELSDQHQAHREAVRTLAEMAAEEIPLDGRLKLTIAVADEANQILFRTRVAYEPGDETD